MMDQELCVSKATHSALIELTKSGFSVAGSEGSPEHKPSKGDTVEAEVLNPFIFVVRLGKIPILLGQLNEVDSGSTLKLKLATGNPTGPVVNVVYD